ncbi:DUF4114 domain-containing protein [Nostoc sp.]|uniref:DUF4114 domain-containing protein n=1 Tax=Nostoc sp. TaxID=1180 RepID=UPI002FF56D0A
MTNYIVNTLNDENDGINNGDVSLRDAINAANATTGADTITFDNSVFNTTAKITLTNGPLFVNQDLTITNTSTNLLTISSDVNNNNTNDVSNAGLFFVNQGSLTLSGLITFSGSFAQGGNGVDGGSGAAEMGGVVFINGGNITVNASVLINNEANSGNGSFGGGSLSATTVNENVVANTVIGTFTSTDPNKNDNFIYSLVTGTGDTDNDVFTIDGNSLKIKTSPDFETKSSYKIRIKATDISGVIYEKPLTITVQDIKEIALTNTIDNIFQIKNDGAKARLHVTLTENNSNRVSELGVFKVDDDKGTINGIVPGATGYTQAALQRSKVILSAITNRPNGFNSELTRLLEFDSGDNLRFYLVKDSTIDAVLVELKNGITSSSVLFSDSSNQKITDLGVDSFSVAWKDPSGNTADFRDLVVKIKPTNEAVPLGTNLQGNQQGEVIDLRDVNQLVKADFIVYREAVFNNFVGFYQVTDANGGIDTNGDGKADILTGQAGYTEAAISRRITGIDLTANNQTTATYTGIFQPGYIFAPLIIVNGKPDAFLDDNSNNDPAVYFPYLGANSDKVDHIRLLGSNIFGFEDLANGGDRDFNDVIVQINLSVA